MAFKAKYDFLKGKERSNHINDRKDAYNHLSGRILDDFPLLFVLYNEAIFNVKLSLRQLFNKKT